MANASLKLEDFSDRELLWALQDHADSDGGITSKDLAAALGIKGLANPTQSVAIRLGWLRRYGIVEKHVEEGETKYTNVTRWALTEAGTTLLNAKLGRAETKFLENMSPDQLLAVTQRVGRVMSYAGAEAATMAGRDWRNAVAVRKRRVGKTP